MIWKIVATWGDTEVEFFESRECTKRYDAEICDGWILHASWLEDGDVFCSLRHGDSHMLCTIGVHQTLQSAVDELHDLVCSISM